MNILRRRTRDVLQPEAMSTIDREHIAVEALDTQEELVATIALRDLNLIYQLIETIDEAEREELDPHRLSKLYRLDHLANRLRRSNEGLLLLSGHGVPRGREGAMSLADIARAAAGGSKDFRRIQIDTMPPRALIAGGADDTVLLLAQLLDNALELSPEKTPVRVGAHQVSAGIALRVEDQGIGLPLSQIPRLNARLAEIPVLGVEATRQMGLYVVALLAHRLGALVQLQPRPGGGTIALIVIPEGLVTELPPAVTAPVREAPARGVDGDRWARSPAPAEFQGVTAHGLPRRTRPRQLEHWRPSPHPPRPSSRPADPQAVLRDISEFEAGALRARQDLGGAQ
jgi:signal transduction histidine kinase